MTYLIVQKYISKNRSGQALTPIGMVLHDTDTKGATDENEQAYFNNNTVSASAHAFIDWDSITETVPDNEVAWGSGPTSNHKFLQVELCVPLTHDVAKFTEVWNRAVWYFAFKFINKLKINTVTKDNLLSHAEVSNKWHETDHQDPVEYFKEYGKTVDDFRAAVQAEINNQLNVKQAPEPNQPVINVNLQLQQTLNKLKIRDGKGNTLIEDGIIGSCTKDAVKRLQSICGLVVDGQVSAQTQVAINTILSKPLLQVGSKGIPVRYLQYRIGVTYDGDFGWDTNRKVAIWQGQNGLSQDGIVGPASWAKLIG